MSPRNTGAARRARDAARDLALLRDAVTREELVHGTDRWIRRLVRQGYASAPDYAYGAARDATAVVTDAGRRAVHEADERDEGAGT